MSAVEDLIVAMGFDNSKFEAGVKVSLATLTALKSSLKFNATANGIDDVQASANRFTTAGMGAQVDGISAKFLALSTVAITALSNITNKVVDAGIAMGKSLTVDPIMQGFQEYELKMGSIQTILANTSKDGTTLTEVTASLDELNTYADQTIYNFGDMTKNIGLFTNAGIGVQDATSMIKGFSNEAAASGTSAEGAAGAAYQLSQALSAGVITLMDWKSLTNVGMGNANMKDGIIQIADAMGAFEGTTVTAEEAAKDFNGTLEKKWLSADVMENYLKIQAEGESEVGKELMRNIGLSDEQQAAFIKQQKIAADAATKVRTWTQLVGTLREGVGSGWSQTADIILGDFDQATELFSGIYNTIGPMIDSFGNARNELLQGWADGGGRTMAIDALKLGFEALMSVMIPIKEAFRQIFPPMTVDTLLRMTQAIRDFAAKLQVGGETADKIKRTFAGVFAIFGIGVSIIKGLFSGFMQLFGSLSGGSGGFLTLTAKIGDFLVKIHEAVKSGDIFKRIFSTIATVLSAPIAMISNFAQAVGEMIGAMGDGMGAAKQFFDILFKGDFNGGPLDEDSKIVDTLFTIREALATAGSALSQFWNILAKGKFVGGIFEEDSPIVDWLFKIREGLAKLFSADGFKVLLGAGAGVGLAFALKAALKKAFSFGGDDGGIFDSLKEMFGSIGGTFDGLSDVFENVTGSLSAMQNNLKAGTLLKIAAAIGIMALSLKLLATIDGGALVKALTAVTVAFSILLVGMTILSKIAGGAGIAQIPALAAAMAILAVAILLLSVSVKLLSTMSWEELAKGLGGLAAMMAMIVLTAKGLSKAEGPMIRAGIAMIPLAIGIRLLVMSVKALAEMSWSELLKGMAGLAGSLVGVGLALRLMPANMPAIGLGLALVGGAMLLISMSIKNLGNTDTGVLVKGILGIGGALGIMGIALRLFPKNMLSISAGLVLVAAALIPITAVVKTLGGMSWEELARGLIGLGGAIGILGLGLMLMNGTLMGSAALAVAAVALALLLPPVVALSMLSWQQLLTGLGGLAGIFLVLGVAGLLMGPIVPVLVALGAAMALMGIGMLGLGFGAQAFAAALVVLVGLGAGLKAALIGLMDMIPLMAAAFAAGVVSFITTLAGSATELVGAAKTLISALLDVFIELIPKAKEVIMKLLEALVEIIITNAPRIAEAAIAIIDAILTVLTDAVPKIVDAAITILLAFLTGIRDKIGDVVTVVGEIIVAFIDALATQTVAVVDAAIRFIVTVLNGIADSIRTNMGPILEAIGEVGKAIIQGLINGIGNGIGAVADAARNLAKGALDAAKDFLGIHSPSREFTKIGEFVGEGLVIGLEKSVAPVKKAAGKVATGVVAGFSKGLGTEMPKALESIFKTLETGAADAKFWGPNSPATAQLQEMNKAVIDAELQLASFYGEVNLADPASIEKYVESAGGNLKYLAGLFQGVKDAAGAAFGMLAKGEGLDAVLGNEDVLTKLLNGVLSVLPGVQGMAISLGLAIVDGLLGIFVGEGTTVLGTIGKWITKAVRTVGGWFGIKFPDPVKETAKEGEKALDDYIVKVEDGHGRFNKLTKEGIKALKDAMTGANTVIDEFNNVDPKITPVLDLTEFTKDKDKMLSGLSAPLSIDTSANKASSIYDTQQALRELDSAEPAVQQTTNVEFKQYNNSPKALSHVEIYKQTNGQLAMAKEALKIS